MTLGFWKQVEYEKRKRKLRGLTSVVFLKRAVNTTRVKPRAHGILLNRKSPYIVKNRKIGWNLEIWVVCYFKITILSTSQAHYTVSHTYTYPDGPLPKRDIIKITKYRRLKVYWVNQFEKFYDDSSVRTLDFGTKILISILVKYRNCTENIYVDL